MTQSTPAIGANKSGIQYRTEDNDGKKALLNHHKGATAPSYAEAGIIWLDDSATPWILKVYDGTDWIVLGEINASTNIFNPYTGNAAPRFLNHAADTGAANAYAIAPSPPVTAYITGQIVTLKPANASTGAATLAVNGLAAKNIKLLDGTSPASGAMAASGIYQLVYDGTNFVLLNPSLGSGAYLAAGTAANNLVQMTAAAKLPAVDGSLLTNLPPPSSVPNTATVIVKDSNLTIQDDGDTTKQVKFQASGIATGTTRTLTVPNADGTLALTSDLAAAAPNASYRTLLQFAGSVPGGVAAGTYYNSAGLYDESLVLSGATSSGAPSTIYLAAADYPTVNGVATKLRISAQLYTNDTAPTGNYTISLHPITRPATSGASGQLIFTVGTAVASLGVTFTAPGADGLLNAVSSDVALPADGHYIIALVTTATTAAASRCGIWAYLQMRN